MNSTHGTPASEKIWLSLPKMPSWQVLDRLGRLDPRAPKKIDASSAVSYQPEAARG
jgi:hypothetical protein